MATRMSAAARREQTIKAALAEFGRRGYEGTSTAAIAERVGVSQPYLFRLFPSKHALFLAAAEHCFDVLAEEMRDAAGGLHGKDATRAMGRRYLELLRSDHALLQFQLQLYASALDDEAVRELSRAKWAGLWRLITSLAGGDAEEAVRFVSVGMLLNVLTTFDIPFEPGDRLPASLHAWSQEETR
ncbi:TetR/AcrR family transcriptional regulator [Actinomadura macrotermitis]|uniref:HTH tetR-type domain-containing protein n=1 Tax=Actinomadura macrotermitis TaxID=2585200 RepID=A0A7K0BYA9_9ACTN|nr:TetR/AcrR family transcriptional regulator [Actinomadura macrotermitis]MQY06159.1 hypothetical protein [Actinomadura macrotermitis]